MRDFILMWLGIGVFLLVCFGINDIAQRAKQQERERLDAEWCQKFERELAEIQAEKYKREIGTEQKSELEETKDELAEVKQLIADKKYLEAIAKLKAMEKEEK